MPRKDRQNDSNENANALDFTNLNAEDVTELPKSTRDSKVFSTPVPGWLTETRETDTAKAVTLPTDQVKSFTNMIRNAATVLDIGARVRVKDNGDRTSTVTFKGSDKRARKSDA